MEYGQRPSKVSPEATPEGKEESGVVLLSNHEERSLPTNNDSDEEEASDQGESMLSLLNASVTIETRWAYGPDQPVIHSINWEGNNTPVYVNDSEILGVPTANHTVPQANMVT